MEDGIEPVDTAFDYVENKVILSPDAAQRRGIQAVIAVTVNGSDRAEAAVGEAVELELRATVPPGAGTIVSADWDFDGTGFFPFSHDGTAGPPPGYGPLARTDPTPVGPNTIPTPYGGPQKPLTLPPN
ncbi:MAG: hypothetical protein QOG95_3484 [Mycobacterium sp.]|nr:hypothetical protein [Mycobacterium sp.]